MIKNNITRLLALFAATFSALSLTSCLYAPKELDSLDNTLVAYERAIRWRNYNGARALQVKPMKVSDFKRQRLKELRITSYRIIEKVIAPDYSKAELLVDIRYYYDKSAIEKVVTDRQLWLYDKKRNRWQLESPFPDFKLY